MGYWCNLGRRRWCDGGKELSDRGVGVLLGAKMFLRNLDRATWHKCFQQLRTNAERLSCPVAGLGAGRPGISSLGVMVSAKKIRLLV